MQTATSACQSDAARRLDAVITGCESMLAQYDDLLARCRNMRSGLEAQSREAATMLAGSSAENERPPT